MAKTLKQLVIEALRAVGAAEPGEEPEAHSVSDALALAQDMLDSWSNERLLVPLLTRESFPLLAQRSYTMGPGGDFDTARPLTLVSAVLKDPTGLERPLILASRNQWDNLGLKDSVAIPRFLYFHDEYPLASLEFSSIPTAGDTLELVSQKTIAELGALTDSLELPPGYNRLFRLGLTIEVAPEYGFAVSNETIGAFQQAWIGIKRTKAANRSMQMRVDPALRSGRRHYDINGGPG